MPSSTSTLYPNGLKPQFPFPTNSDELNRKIDIIILSSTDGSYKGECKFIGPDIYGRDTWCATSTGEDGIFIYVDRQGWGWDSIYELKFKIDDGRGNDRIIHLWKLYEDNYLSVKVKPLQIGDTCPKCKAMYKQRELFMSTVVSCMC